MAGRREAFVVLALGSRSVTAVSLAAVPDVKHEDDELVIMDLVQDAPVTRPHPPSTGIADKLGGLAGARIVNEAINSAPHLLLDGFVQSPERSARLVAQNDLVGHAERLQPGFGLDVIPGDERLT